MSKSELFRFPLYALSDPLCCSVDLVIHYRKSTERERKLPDEATIKQDSDFIELIHTRIFKVLSSARGAESKFRSYSGKIQTSVAKTGSKHLWPKPDLTEIGVAKVFCSFFSRC